VTRRSLLAAGIVVALTTTIQPRPRVESAMGRPVIFVVAHPDDETLGFGPQLRRHVVYDRDVHVLLLTRGEATRVREELNGERITPWWRVLHNPVVEGYAPLTQTDVGTARLAELVAAVGCMGIPPDRVHEARLPDGGVTVEAAKAAILELADTLPDTGLWSHSYLVDNHPDHLAAGQAVRQLGEEQPTRFWDRRYMIEPQYWTDPRISQLPHPPSLADAADADERDRTINACRAYGVWQPRSGAFAVGMHSVDRVFAAMQARPAAMVHRD